MGRFKSLLLPLDGSAEAAKSAQCALWLAKTLGATLHVLHATTQLLPWKDALDRLHLSDAQHGQVILHQLPKNASAAVLDAIMTYDVDLVVMSACGESTTAGPTPRPLGTVAQAVIEHSPVPVLLLPLRYRAMLPCTSILAAASGEMAADEALEVATQLAAALQLKVTVVHAEDGAGEADSMALGAYADAPHYEYPHRIEHMVERGLIHCTHEECRYVHQILLRRGDPATALLEHACNASGVLALGWHGAFGVGRAFVLKRLLEEAECGLLLMRSTESLKKRLLKVGESIDGECQEALNGFHS